MVRDLDIMFNPAVDKGLILPHNYNLVMRVILEVALKDSIRDSSVYHYNTEL